MGFARPSIRMSREAPEDGSRVVTKDHIVGMFKRMVGEGWRISVEDYTAIMEELEKL